MFRILFLRSFLDRVGDLFSANLNQYKDRTARGHGSLGPGICIQGDLVEPSMQELGHQATSFALSEADFLSASLR